MARYHSLGCNINVENEEYLTTIKELPLWDANIDIEKITIELLKLKNVEKLNLVKNKIRELYAKISKNLKLC